MTDLMRQRGKHLSVRESDFPDLHFRMVYYIPYPTHYVMVFILNRRKVLENYIAFIMGGDILYELAVKADKHINYLDIVLLISRINIWYIWHSKTRLIHLCHNVRVPHAIG